MTYVHGTLVAIGGEGVLLTGASGSGKSDLALRLIDRGAMLVGDDQVELCREDGRVVGRVPATIAGRIEVRGVGICPLPHVAAAPITLVVRLDGRPDRLPEPATTTLADIAVPTIDLAAFEASAPIKVELALARLVRGAA